MKTLFILTTILFLFISIFSGPERIEMNFCELLVHKKALETNLQIEGARVCTFETSGEFKSLLKGNQNDSLLVIAHGKSIGSMTLFGQKTSPISYSQVRDWKPENLQVVMATCRSLRDDDPAVEEIETLHTYEGGIKTFVQLGQTLNMYNQQIWEAYLRYK